MGQLNIITLYQTSEGRSIEELSKYYNKPEILIELIKGLIRVEFQNNINQKRVLIKPNWVMHPRNNIDRLCLTTNENFILACLEVILEYKPSEIIIGDAPIQGCVWDKLLADNFLNKIKLICNQYQVPVQVKDFRRTTFNPRKNKLKTGIRPLSDYVIFDVGKKSYLDPVTLEGYNKFRVTNYDPAKLKDTHKPGIHRYCIAREFFEVDVVISLPKIKTHQKTGITGALKNIVGLNGDKDFLPHHRLGGTGRGGDCYPGNNVLRYSAEKIMDMANALRGNFLYTFLTRISSILWSVSFPGREHSLEAGWYGNDTAWRMVMDLNLIAYFGGKDGILSEEPKRKIFSICDGIVAGEGNGPLEPEPLPLGVVACSDNPAAIDVAMATLMGFNYRKFPLLNESSKIFSLEKCKLILNGRETCFDELRNYSISTKPPKGWISYLSE